MNEFLKTKSREPSKCCLSHSNLKSLKRFNIGYKPKFIEPMLSEATSGLNLAAGSTLSSTVIYGLPPVVIFIIEFVPCFIRGRKGEKPSGD